jgi:hypothetical protein
MKIVRVRNVYLTCNESIEVSEQAGTIRVVSTLHIGETQTVTHEGRHNASQVPIILDDETGSGFLKPQGLKHL